MKILITGRPITKKNSMRIFNKRLMPSAAYCKYEHDALWQIKLQMKQQKFSGFGDKKVRLTAKYWMPDKRSKPDLVNLLQATSDILEKADVYDNDRQIVSYDGSRIMGLDKNNPRAEILVEEMKT